MEYATIVVLFESMLMFKPIPRKAPSLYLSVFFVEPIVAWAIPLLLEYLIYLCILSILCLVTEIVTIRRSEAFVK